MSRFAHWEHRTEWLLAAATVVFLVAYTSEVIGNLEGIDLVRVRTQSSCVGRPIVTTEYSHRRIN